MHDGRRVDFDFLCLSRLLQSQTMADNRTGTTVEFSAALCPYWHWLFDNDSEMVLCVCALQCVKLLLSPLLTARLMDSTSEDGKKCWWWW